MALKGSCSLPWFLVKCSQKLTQFQEVSHSFRKFLDSSRKSQTVLGSFNQFSEVSNSSRNSRTVLGILKQFSEFLNSSWKSKTVFGSFKQFLKLSCSRGSKKVVGIFKKFSVLSRAFAELLRGLSKQKVLFSKILE